MVRAHGQQGTCTWQRSVHGARPTAVHVHEGLVDGRGVDGPPAAADRGLPGRTDQEARQGEPRARQGPKGLYSYLLARMPDGSAKWLKPALTLLMSGLLLACSPVTALVYDDVLMGHLHTLWLRRDYI